MIASQPQPGKAERADKSVLRDFLGRQGGAGFAGDFAHKRFHGLLLIVAGAKDPRGEIAPIVQAFAILGDVARGLIGETEVCEEQLPRLKFSDGFERGVPELQLNIRRRSGRKNEWMSFNADAGGVADERDAFGRVKVSDMMRRVSRRIEHLQFARAERKSLAALEHVEIFLGYRQKVAEQTPHIVAIKALGTGEQIRGVSHMICAAHMNINLQMRIFLDKGTGGASVVKMNVGQKNGLQVIEGAMVNSKLLPKILDGRRGTRIDERTKILGRQQRGGNGMRPALPIQIQKDDGVHRRKNSVTQRNQRMQKMALRGIGRRVWGSSRKHLQNDELVEYALGHCGWCRSVARVPREIQSQYRPLKRKNKLSAAYCHASSVQRSGKLKGEDA
jgi:hypothetical protein